MTKNIYHVIFLLGDEMISKIILEDVLDEMIDNICYAKLRINIVKENK